MQVLVIKTHTKLGIYSAIAFWSPAQKKSMALFKVLWVEVNKAAEYVKILVVRENIRLDQIHGLVFNFGFNSLAQGS